MNVCLHGYFVKTTVMKTVFIFILFVVPFFLLGQQAITPTNYPIVTQGERWITENKADSAILLAQNILTKARLDPFQERQAFFLLGKGHFALGAPEDAITPLQKSLVLAQKNRDNPLLLKSHIVLAAALGDKLNPSLDSAMFYLKNAEDLATRLKDTLSLAKIYTNQSNIYFLKEEFKEALKIHYQCENLLKNTTLKETIAINSYGKANNLMEIYNREEGVDNLNGAYEAYKMALSLFQELNLTQNEAHARNALGACMLYMENFKGAENEVKASIKLGATLEDDEVLLNGYYTLTSIYEMQGNAQEAVKSLEGLKIKLEKMGVLGDPTFLKDQFSNSDLSVSLALINAKINNFNKQIENQQVATKNQQLFNGILIATILIVLIGSILLYIRQKNKLLQEKLNTVLKAQEVEFMRVRIEGEEMGRQRIARQIHDGVGGLLVSAKWNLETALEELSGKETKVAARLNENLRLQENSYKELRRVVYELEREDTPWWEDLQKFYQELDNPNKTKIRFYTYNLDKRIGGSIGEEARLIVQEIITNALKHAKASEITVQINQINDELGMIIEDNGVGFDLERVSKGIGLQSLNERCAKLGGSISFETGKGAGTTVFVDIPLKKQSILTENPLLYGTN